MDEQLVQNCAIAHLAYPEHPAATWLASDDATFITSHTINVNDGWPALIDKRTTSYAATTIGSARSTGFRARARLYGHV
jgi:hypothetical protein